MIYFVHIPKTAGLSMQKLFTDNRKPEAVARVYLRPSLTVADLLALPADRVGRLESFMDIIHMVSMSRSVGPEYI